MSTPRSILDRIRLAAAAGRALPPEDGQALALALEVAEREGISIDAALGLAPGWQRATRMRRRDEALRALASTILGSDRERAEQIIERLSDYYGATCHPSGRWDGLLHREHALRLEYQILEADHGDIVGPESIRKIIIG